MKHLRKIAMLLALAMTFTMAVTSCGKDEKKPADDTSVNTADTTDVAPGEETLDLPETIDSSYDTITILTAEGTLHGPDELSDELDVLGEAMYKRRREVEDRLGFEFAFLDIADHNDVMSMARQSIGAGEDDFQMVFVLCKFQVELINEGLYLPISELPYIDLDKPWWNKQYINSVSLHPDDQYVLFGDITYNQLERTVCVFVNLNLLQDRLKMEPDELYQIVRDGEWTIDKMTELVNQVYVDDGDTKNDEDDIHGLVIWATNAMNWMAFSSGVKFTSRNEDGYPELDLNNETTVNLVDKLINLLCRNEHVFVHADNGGHIEKFGNGNALFLVQRFYNASWPQIQEMKDDYGILPVPKYDETVDGYHSVSEQNVQWGAVPVTVTDPEFVSAVAEALAYYSRKYTTPAYFESTLKLKDTRDDASMEMIDIVMEGRDTDFLFCNPLRGMNEIFIKIYGTGQNTFASYYASLETAAQKTLAELIQGYEERKAD